MADSNPVDSPEPPQPTDKSSDEVTYNWTDITKEFFAASADLKLGELLHDEKWVTEYMSKQIVSFISWLNQWCFQGSNKQCHFQTENDSLIMF